MRTFTTASAEGDDESLMTMEKTSNQRRPHAVVKPPSRAPMPLGFGEKRSGFGEKTGVGESWWAWGYGEKRAGFGERWWGYGEKRGGLKKGSGGMEKRWHLDILCTHTHTCAGAPPYAWGQVLCAALRVGTAAEERLAARDLGAGRVGGGVAGRVCGVWLTCHGWGGGITGRVGSYSQKGCFNGMED